MDKIKKWQLPVLILLLAGAAMGFGFFLGKGQRAEADYPYDENLTIVNNDLASSTVSEAIDMAPFWKVWKVLDKRYVATHNASTTVTAQERVWGAIQGLTASLGDPYTVFMPPQDNKDFEENISGNFEGVGMEIGVKDGVLSVISPLKGSPAEQVGIKTGDKIVAINGEPSADFSTDKAVKLIRGPQGTTVKLTVLRDGEDKTLDFAITRAVIDVPTVETKTEGDVFVISLYNFYAQSGTRFRKALKEFTDSGKTKLILDLRGNPGGYLDAAVEMASWFLPKGQAVVREEYGNGQEGEVHRSYGYDIFNENLKMIILVDGGSASASEILSGALQEYGIAKLVGTKTFGKGSVQEMVSITDDTSLKVTIARWLTPFGKSISDGGLTPDYEVKVSEEDVKAGRDPQMAKALELLK